MDNPVHNRRSALDIHPNKRIPPSFYVALGVAIAVHAGFAYYLLDQRFGTGLEQTWTPPDQPRTIVIDMPDKAKPTPPLEKETIQVHKTPAPATEVETTPIIPVDEPRTVADTVIDAPPLLPQAGGGTVTGTGASDAPAQPAVVVARWSRFPDGAALANYYPARAEEDEVEGTATVQCVVLDTAGRVSCTAVSEKPGGYGFGAATVRMVQDKGRVDISQGNVQVGSVLRQTVVWRMN
ncbi:MULTISPECIES: energy transducer TonB [Asticcacaulis]|uniref:energy transducer TonB n=1 Tax=Asticcacaulis TaxID=76890 RepID=UPI001AE18FDF|nr:MULTISPECIES: energy transducer TonB [Asticcacaulis]MBP2160695.1 protein TonB [Asticcacaulis solisilvae]MDR6801740.1 protein TonB [Asticcacaulis sp. BE141]